MYIRSRYSYHSLGPSFPPTMPFLGKQPRQNLNCTGRMALKSDFSYDC